MVYDAIGSSPVDWASMTAPEVRELATQDGSVLVVPVGSLEQHGHHLAVVTDTVLVDAIAHAGAERTDDDVPVLVTPPVWTGHSPHHLPFGGTTSLDVETLLHVLEQIADTTLGNGFDALILLNGHGGNAALIDNAVSEIGTDHPDVEILGLSYFHLAASFIDEIRESEIGGIAHGGEFETSLMLYLRPDLVREDRITATMYEKPYEHESEDLFDSGPVSSYRPFNAYTESGAIGAPELASADKGEELLRGLGRELSDFLTDVSEKHR